jgi:hypothetical protein
VSPKEIIESGILEEYVIGVLPDIESEEITRLSLEHPEIMAEIRMIENALVQSFSAPVNPEWKKDVLSALKEAPVVPIQGVSATDPKVIPITGLSEKQEKSQKWFWAAASFGGLFIISAAANFYLLTKNQSLAQELTDVKVSLSKETEEKSVFAANYKKSQDDYQLLFNPDIMRIEMAGTPAFAGNSSVLFWNPESGEVIWDGSNLPKLNTDQQYQLWAIVDGKPQNGGMLTSGTPAKMLDAVSAQAFAVTIEPNGGSESPTLDKMVVFAAVGTKTI